MTGTGQIGRGDSRRQSGVWQGVFCCVVFRPQTTEGVTAHVITKLWALIMHGACKTHTYLCCICAGETRSGTAAHSVNQSYYLHKFSINTTQHTRTHTIMVMKCDHISMRDGARYTCYIYAARCSALTHHGPAARSVHSGIDTALNRFPYAWRTSPALRRLCAPHDFQRL